MRLGAESSVHEDVREYCVESSGNSSSSSGGGGGGGAMTVADVAGRVDRVRVVCCTVLAAARHPLMSKWGLDYTVMDEAGQISQPAAIGALLCTRKFLLVGDDYQLPPLVVSQEAQALGMDVSLFKRLSEANPQTVVSLSEQYRMNSDIMKVGKECSCDTDLCACVPLRHRP